MNFAIHVPPQQMISTSLITWLIISDNLQRVGNIIHSYIFQHIKDYNRLPECNH